MSEQSDTGPEDQEPAAGGKGAGEPGRGAGGPEGAQADTAAKRPVEEDDVGDHAETNGAGPRVSAHEEEAGAIEQDDIDAIMGFSEEPETAPDPSGDGVDGSDPFTLLTRSRALAREHLPMLDVIFEQLTRNLSDSMRALIAELADVEYEGSRNVTFGEYRKRVSFPALLAVVDMVEWEEQALVHADASLVYSIVDMMLGGRRAPAAKPEGRPYTRLEKELVGDFLDKVFEGLTSAFSGVAPVTFRLSRFEDDPAFAAIARDSNPSVWMTVTIELGNRRGQLNFVIPYGALEPARDRLSHIGGVTGGRSDRIWRQHFMQEVEESHGLLTVELARARLPMAELLSWQEGCLLELDTKIDDPVRILLNGREIAAGRMTVSERHYAVQVAEDVANEHIEGTDDR